MVRFLVGTRVVCYSVVAVCRRRVPAVARSVSGGDVVAVYRRRVPTVARSISSGGVVAVRYSTDALVTRGVL